MEFGSEHTASLILQYVDTGDSSLYDPIHKIIQKDAMNLLRKDYRLSQQDREDIVSIVEMNVFQQLYPFSVDIPRTSVGQRNSYLKTAVFNTRKSFFQRLGLQKCGLDSVSLIEDIDDTYGDNLPERKAEGREKLFHYMDDLFRLNTSPEKILCFILMQLQKKGNNGPARDVSKQMTGLSIESVYEYVLHTFKTELGYKIPQSTFLLLWDKVEPVREKILDVTPRWVTDSTNWVGKTIKERITGETHE